jgi:hypothetical protein
MNIKRQAKPTVALVSRMIDDIMEVAFTFFRGADKMTTEEEFDQIDTLVALLTLKTETAKYISRHLLNRPRRKRKQRAAVVETAAVESHDACREVGSPPSRG